VSAAVDSLAVLATALRERGCIIADRELYAHDPGVHLARLQAVSERIVQLSAALPQPVPSDLAHFLERCSYEKALAWIEAHPASLPASGGPPANRPQ
jgi:hypothetical protein